MSGEERINTMAAYQLAGSCRAAAVICGTTHETVTKVVTEELARMKQSLTAHRAPGVQHQDRPRSSPCEREGVEGRTSAKRLLPARPGRWSCWHRSQFPTTARWGQTRLAP